MKLNKSKLTIMILALAMIFASAVNIVRAHQSGGSDMVSIAESEAEDCYKAKKTANDLIDQLVAENFDAVREYFNENMKQSLSVEQLKGQWNGLKTDRGPYKSRDKSLYQEFPTYYAVVTLVQMEESRIWIIINFGEDGKVLGLFYNPA